MNEIIIAKPVEILERLYGKRGATAILHVCGVLLGLTVVDYGLRLVVDTPLHAIVLGLYHALDRSRPILEMVGIIFFALLPIVGVIFIFWAVDKTFGTVLMKAVEAMKREREARQKDMPN